MPRFHSMTIDIDKIVKGPLRCNMVNNNNVIIMIIIQIILLSTNLY